MVNQASRRDLLLAPAQSIRLLLRPEEAAEALGISRSRFYVLLEREHIRSIKVGRSRRIPLAELERWIARQVDEPGARAGQSSEE